MATDRRSRLTKGADTAAHVDHQRPDHHERHRLRRVADPTDHFSNEAAS